MAVKPSPAVGRIARILNAIAQAPEGELGLAEIARRARENKATVHSLLLALDAEGFVVRREPTPSYSLGGALIALGDAARGSVTVLDAVEPELVRLRDELDLSTMAGSIEADEVVVLSARSVDHPFGFKVSSGHRSPHRMPIGPIYVAWSDRATQQTWYERGNSRSSVAKRRTALQELSAIRQRGWSATIVRHVDGGKVYGEVTGDEVDSDSLHVVGVSAPVWAPEGSLACSLALVGFDVPITGLRLRELAARVVESADRATAKLGGTSPG